MIADVFQASHQFSSLNIPRPFACLCAIFRLKPPSQSDSTWRALRAWSEINDVCENESFGLHSQSSDPVAPGHSPTSSHRIHHPPPSLTVPGTSLQLPSPFHFKLHIITRLAFNEQGRITHHRDFWDVKDVMGLVPGVSLVQWLGTRIAARSLTFTYHIASYAMPSLFEHPGTSPEVDIEGAPALTPAAAYSASVKNALGLEGI
ncbi:hypothetical protein ONZ45_g10529 [Pleurotus djamor]|nr:hypothetical protein ONZ45_g10529 [Pleurotus djamor]